MREKYVSVDIEASGPIPGEYSMLAIGACLVDDDAATFSATLKPLTRIFHEEVVGSPVPRRVVIGI